MKVCVKFGNKVEENRFGTYKIGFVENEGDTPVIVKFYHNGFRTSEYHLEVIKVVSHMTPIVEEEYHKATGRFEEVHILRRQDKVVIREDPLSEYDEEYGWIETTVEEILEHQFTKLLVQVDDTDYIEYYLLHPKDFLELEGELVL